MKVTTKLNIVISGLKLYDAPKEDIVANLDNFSFEYAHDSEQTPEEFVTAISSLVDLFNKAIGSYDESVNHKPAWERKLSDKPKESRAGERPSTDRYCSLCEDRPCSCKRPDPTTPDITTELQVGDIVYMANNMEAKIPLYVKAMVDLHHPLHKVWVGAEQDSRRGQSEACYPRNELHFVKRGTN
jgi:hypothetical protein